MTNLSVDLLVNSSSSDILISYILNFWQNG